MAKSDFLEVELIKHLFRTGSYTKPTVLGIALFIGDPLDTGAGGAEVSTSGTNYVRIDRPPLDANWDATSGTDGQTANTAAITFGAPSANWGTVTHIGIFDAISGGNLLYSETLTADRLIESGDAAPLFAIGALTITES